MVFRESAWDFFKKTVELRKLQRYKLDECESDGRWQMVMGLRKTIFFEEVEK